MANGINVQINVARIWHQCANQCCMHMASMCKSMLQAYGINVHMDVIKQQATHGRQILDGQACINMAIVLFLAYQVL
jgi:hypothetical protein